MNRTQMSAIVDRFTRLVDGNLDELKQKHALIKQYERERDFERAAVEKGYSDRLIHQIQNALQQVMAVRSELAESARCQFDTRIEPIRLRIQATLSAISSPSANSQTDAENPFRPTGRQSTNPFEEDTNLFENCFHEESPSSQDMTSDYEFQLQQEQTHSRKDVEALRLRVEQVKADAEATKKLESDIQDLNQIMIDLAELVHNQNELVDSIEENIERTNQYTQQGNREVKQAIRHKQAKYPIVAAGIGSVLLGGPVGIIASSAVAGIAAAVGGGIAGLWGGRALNRRIINENSDNNN